MKILRSSRAFALLLVLITIVLSVTIAVFFLSSAGRERRGISLYANSNEVRHLANTAVNRVIGQINAATKEGTASVPVSWISQPGMVRTFNQDGQPASIYKLYSWDAAPVSPGSFNPASSSETPPSGWNARKAEFVDLNQPINGVYPILDPGALPQNGSIKVAGFNIDSSAPAVNGSGSAAPMPVKWLYVLNNGQMVAPSAQNGTSVQVPGATVDNPIVGRVAFWTDDETSKVNINTASEGAYWDWPKAATPMEMQFAGNPPMGGEFNRVSGHPAMTSLSAVFSELDPGDRWTSGLSTYRNRLNDLLKLNPRVPVETPQFLSSRGGTYPIETLSFDYGPTVSLPKIPDSPLPGRTDRLYVSPDEMVFGPATRTRSTVISPAMLQERSFFLTATSRAPETTLFETPRISLWPVTWPWASAHAKLTNRQVAAVSSPNPNTTLPTNNAWMRAEERLLAFTSTLNRLRPDGGDRYYFQRQNPDSPTHDFDNIQRNQQLIQYLQRMTNSRVPGYGTSFANKYSNATRDFIVANLFNVVRSLVNQYTIQDDGRMLYSFTPVSFSRFLRPNNVSIKGYNEGGAFAATPLRINIGSGSITTLSDFPMLREVALVFFATNRELPKPSETPGANLNNPYNWTNLINVGGLDANGNRVPPVSNYPQGSRTTQMRAVMLLDFSAIRGGSKQNQPIFWIKVTGAGMTAAGSSLKLDNATAQLDYRNYGSGGKAVPPYMLPLFQKDSSGALSEVKTMNNGNVTAINYGLISDPIAVNPNESEFSFTGGEVEIQVYGIKNGDPNLDPTGDSNLLLGSYKVDTSGWNGNLAIPLAPRWNYYDQMNKVGLCPNPNFQVWDNLNGKSFPYTRWASTEIAPGYQSSDSASDPALGGTSSVVAYNTMFPTPVGGGTTGAVNYNPASSLTFPYGRTVTYAFTADGGARIMTDYANRMRFFATRKSPPKTVWFAENSKFPLNMDAAATPPNMMSPGGFPSITPFDTVISVVPRVAPAASAPGQGDPRLASFFVFDRSDQVYGSSVRLRQVQRNTDYPRLNLQVHSLGAGDGRFAATGFILTDQLSTLSKTLAPTGMARLGLGSLTGRIGYGGSLLDDGDAVGVRSFRLSSSITNSVGDWSSQAGNMADGGVIPRPDQDFQALSSEDVPTSFTYQTPYFRATDSASDGVSTAASKGYFSANRQIPSPISLLGALPSSKQLGWQTLAFSPNPAASSHPGLTGLPDHVLLDLFWMPVAEPFPISEEFSTGGKVNLNYQIVPFTYIQRRTALAAALKATWITALSNNIVRDYKSADAVKGVSQNRTRYPIDEEATLDRFDSEVFNKNEVFRSASQISEMWLVPEGGTIPSFWNDKTLTSDTAREAPYDSLYSRVTTKSNTFTVHWRVQSLRKPVSDSSPSSWDESKDRVQAELRGSTLIERFIDPNATDIPDYATQVDAEPLSNFYKWRTVSDTYFQP